MLSTLKPSSIWPCFKPKTGSMFAEYEDARKKVEEWKTKYDALKSNADAFEVGMDEARLS